MAGTPRYIPSLMQLLTVQVPDTSDSEFALSIRDNDDSIGVSPTFTISLNIGCSRSMSAIAGENE